ncbi:MAG: hypothetical protein WAV20_24800 [Blastocatellia bacterium]
MTVKKIVYVAAFLLVGALSGHAQEQDRYMLLATTKTSTMQKELDESSAKGYRVVMGSPTSGSEMAILMERAAQPPDTYKYRLLATTRTGTMQKELNEAAQEGYRLLVRTMIAKTQLVGGVEVVVLLERSPKQDKRYEYKLLATTKTSTLQKEVAEAQSEGYVLAGMVSRGEHMVIMEKESLK